MNILGTLSECQMVWIHVRTDLLSMSKLFAKVIGKQHKSLLAKKELKVSMHIIYAKVTQISNPILN